MPETGERDIWLLLDDAALLAQCHIDTFRSSGPGGQHANKTSSAVRLRHQPTGLSVVAEDTRSQHENKAKAIKRLRLAIALNARQPTGDTWQPPSIFKDYISKTSRIEISRRNPHYVCVVAIVLDAVAACDGGLRDAATSLGLTTGQLSRFVTSEGKLLDAANRIRKSAGLRPLSA